MLFLGVVFGYLCLSHAGLVNERDLSETINQAIENINHFAADSKLETAGLEDYYLFGKLLNFNATNIVFGDLSSLTQVAEPVVVKNVNNTGTEYLYRVVLRLDRPFAFMEYKMTEAFLSSSGNMTVTPRENSLEVLGSVFMANVEGCSNNIISMEAKFGDLSLDVQPHDVPHFFAKQLINTVLKGNSKNMFDFGEKIYYTLNDKDRTFLKNIEEQVCQAFS